jgi:hypothetical protein
MGDPLDDVCEGHSSDDRHPRLRKRCEACVRDIVADAEARGFARGVREAAAELERRSWGNKCSAELTAAEMAIRALSPAPATGAIPAPTSDPGPGRRADKPWPTMAGDDHE